MLISGTGHVATPVKSHVVLINQRTPNEQCPDHDAMCARELHNLDEF